MEERKISNEPNISAREFESSSLSNRFFLTYQITFFSLFNEIMTDLKMSCGFFGTVGYRRPVDIHSFWQVRSIRSEKRHAETIKSEKQVRDAQMMDERRPVIVCLLRSFMLWLRNLESGFHFDLNANESLAMDGHQFTNNLPSYFILSSSFSSLFHQFSY